MLSEFARLLLLYRKSRGLTQAEIATHAAIEASLISKFERGTRYPDRTMVLAIAKALQLSQIETDDLLLAARFAPRNLGYLELGKKLEEFSSRIEKLQHTIENLDEKLAEIITTHSLE